MSQNIHAVSIYSPAAGSTRVRIYDWLRHLGRRAIEHQYAGLPSAGPRLLSGHMRQVLHAEREIRALNVPGDTVLISREASPLSRGKLEARLLSSAGRGVYDFDDALFSDTSRRRQAFGGAHKFRRAAAAADCVIAGNEYLAEWASEYQQDVRVIPSCVEPSDYRMAQSSRTSPPRLVWLGSRSTEQYLVPILDDLLEIHRSHGARLTLISASQQNDALAKLQPMLDRVPWNAETFTTYLADADLALAPLADTPLARGKCAYKILQYGAAGLPIVGSPVGANREALRLLGGIAIENSQDWRDAISSLLTESQSQARHRGRAARAAVEEHYSFARWRQAWLEAVVV